MVNIGTEETTDAQSTGAPVDDTPVDDTAVGDNGEIFGSGRGEAIVGVVLVGLTVAAALYFRWRPGPNFLDHWGTSLVHPALSNTWWKHLTYLRSMPVLVGGSILAAVVVAGRDRWRALACLVAPPLAVLLTEYVLKPEIARRYAQVLSFPSGTTTVVGAVTMAFVIAVPGRIRPVVATIGAFLVGLECMAVVALQWHFPTDGLGGAVFGAGMVLLIDGLIHLAVSAERRRRGTTPVGDPVPAA